MLSLLPRRSGWAYRFAHSPQPYQPSPINAPWCFLTKLRSALGPVRFFLGRPMYFVCSLILAVSVLFAPAVAVAQIQPGSAGGTIGKHEKSISGGEEQPKAKTRSSRARPRSTSHVTAAHRVRGPAAAPPASSDCPTRALSGLAAQFSFTGCD